MHDSIDLLPYIYQFLSESYMHENTNVFPFQFKVNSIFILNLILFVTI